MAGGELQKVHMMGWREGKTERVSLKGNKIRKNS